MYQIHMHEIPIIEALQTLRTPWLDQLFLALNIFDYDTTYFVIIIFIWHMVSEKAGFNVLYLEAIATTAFMTLKDICAQPRPYELVPQLGVLETMGPGFPSGAATEVVTVIGFAFFLLKPTKTIFKVLALCLMVLVGLTRVYLGAHFISDVIGGYSIGGLILAGYAWLYEPVDKFLKRYSPLYQFLMHSAFIFCLMFINPALMTLLLLLYGAMLWHVFLYPLTNHSAESFSNSYKLFTTLSAIGGMIFLHKVLATNLPLYVSHPITERIVHAVLDMGVGILIGASSYIGLIIR